MGYSPADTLFTGGVVITMAEDVPHASALAITDGRILAVGEDAEIERYRGPHTEHVDLAGRALLPGFVEAHGHPTIEMVITGPDVLDIRPVVCATASEAMTKLREAIATVEPGAWVGAFGWDPLLQEDLPNINGALLDELAPDNPLTVMHNSGHSAWANTAALKRLELTKDTPDPVGSYFERDAAGNLTGAAYESPATQMLMSGVLSASDGAGFDELMANEHEQLARVGVTTTSDMAFDPGTRQPLRDFYRNRSPKVRMRLYEKSTPAKSSDVAPGADSDDPLLQQIGIKIWADGSPWVGNIATSFPYLDTPKTRAIGLPAGHRGCANYSREQLEDIVAAYFPLGWQIACHVHGDDVVDTVLDVFEEAQQAHPERTDTRLRLEHCGTMTAEQYQRAARLGVTCSLFVDHIYYWGDVLVDGLFGERGESWTAAGAAVDAGVRVSFHNDPPVTPEEPLRNIQVAVTRRSRNGRVVGEQHRVSVDQALRAQTIDAAWQLFADPEIGSLEPGKRADLVLLDSDPHDVDPERIGDIPVHATYLDGAVTHQFVK